MYVALGDSVAAGDGLPEPTDSSACNRSNESYPNIVASSLKLDLKSLACSGATISEGILSSQMVNGLAVVPQMTQLAGLQKVSLVTLTVGANDVDWAGTITKCFTSECGTPEDTARQAKKTTQLTADLHRVLDGMKAQPKVIVTGYYQLVPASQQTCVTPIGVTDKESFWLRTQEEALNKAIQDTTRSYKFAMFADPDFSGHELCTKEPWIQDLQDKAPFHPTAAGQNAVAQTVINSYH